MSMLPRLFLALLCTAAAATAAHAQQLIPPPAAAPEPARGSITITVQASASDSPVRGLTAADFHLFDNKAPRQILKVKEATPAAEPASVFLVIDAVNVNYTHVAYVRSEVSKYLQANGGKLAHPTTFIILEDKGAQIQKGFSTDGNALLAALNQYGFGLREIRRDSGFWGADERTQISLAALQQMIAYGGTLPGRKLILWISPGWPLLTGPRIDLSSNQEQRIFADIVNLSTSMRQANITLNNINPIGPGESLLAATYYQDFVKGVRKKSDVQIADLSLQVLAVQSGGRTFISNSDVAGNALKSAADGDGWYEITFDPAAAEQPNEYHHLQVDIGRPGVTARTRDGYYAQP